MVKVLGEIFSIKERKLRTEFLCTLEDGLISLNITSSFKEFDKIRVNRCNGHRCKCMDAIVQNDSIVSILLALLFVPGAEIEKNRGVGYLFWIMIFYL
jgi:hypothetical protein